MEKLKTVEVRQNRQSELTAECWLIQMSGFSACGPCVARDTKECGGQNIRKTHKNEKGFSVPLGEN